MAPVMVCVVLTGMPARAVPNRVIAPAAFGTETAKRLELGDFLSHGVDDAPTTEIGSGGDGGVSSQDDGPAIVPPIRKHVGLAHEPSGVERAGDDAHGFLRVVAAVSEAIGGGGDRVGLG